MAVMLRLHKTLHGPHVNLLHGGGGVEYWNLGLFEVASDAI